VCFLFAHLRIADTNRNIFPIGKKSKHSEKTETWNSISYLIFAPPCQLWQVKRKLHYMTQKRKYRGAAWLVFFISAAALAFAIVSHWPWLTLIIPFVTTSFVWAMDIV